MSFLGCSVCSSDYARAADGTTLYCPVCDAPSREQMEHACRTAGEGIAMHNGVTTMVVMYKHCPDGTIDIAWHVRGYESDYKLALATVAKGFDEAAKLKAPLKFLRDAVADPVVVPPIAGRSRATFEVSQDQVLRSLAKDPRGPFVQAQDFEPYLAMPVHADSLGRFVAGFGWVRLGQGIAFCCNVPFVTLEVPTDGKVS